MFPPPSEILYKLKNLFLKKEEKNQLHGGTLGTE